MGRLRSARTTTGSRRSVVGEDDYGLLIGKRGQTIDALQLLCYQAAFRGLRERKRVVVDAAGYRERRREVLVSRADRAAEQALSGSCSVEMDPMSAQERRVVHEHLKERSGIETFSEGDEPQRVRGGGSPRLRVSERPCPPISTAARGPSALARPLQTRSSTSSPTSGPRSARSPTERAWKVHVADSLTGLEIARAARSVENRRYRLWSWVSGPGARGGPASSPGRPDRVRRPQVRLHAARHRRGGHLQRARRRRSLGGVGKRGRPRGLRSGDRPSGRPPLDPGGARLAAARRRRRAGRLEGQARRGRGGCSSPAPLRSWRCTPSGSSTWAPTPAADTATST